MRFPEFSGEWENARLSSFAKKITKKNKGNTISNILCNSANFGIIPQSEYFDRDIANSENTDTYYIVESGDFVYNPRKSVTSPYGPVNMYKGKNLGIISPLYLCFSVKGISKEYLLNWFKGNKWYRYVYSHGDMGVRYDRVSIKDDIFFHMPINVPNIDEQEKISKILNLIDKRIATQNKIIEKMESLIKGITDKLLCNFSWEKVYLRSFMEFYPTNSFSWEQLSYEKGTIRNLHYGLIHGISTKSVTTKTLPFISSNKADSRFVCCQNGDVAFADASEDTADIGKAVEFTDVDNTNVVCGLHTIHGRDVKGLTIVGFKGFMFNSSYFHEQVRRVAQGTKVFSISANNLSSCYVYIPDKSEQTKITGLLYSMEMKISSSSKLLERYKIQKEYLLRQMFI